MGQKKAKNHHVSFGKSRLARAALPFSASQFPLVLFAMTRFEIIDGETNRYDSGQVSREYKSQG